MKNIVIFYAILALVTACGSKDRSDNRDLRERNDALEARSQASEESAAAAAKRAEEESAKARASEISAAEAKQSRDQEATRADAETKRANEAELQKVITQKALDAELAKTHEVIALRPYSGVWVTEQSVPGLATTCSILTLVSSMHDTITRAVICGANDPLQIQVDVFTPSDFGIRADLFPNSRGLSVSTEKKSSTCFQQVSILAPVKEFVFEQSTRAGAVRATYMFADEGSRTITSASGASIAEFERQQSCESILKLAAKPAATHKKLVQTAALLCNGTATTIMTSGCFTANGFIAVISR